MKKIHISNITEIKENKIYYLNGNGKADFIELESCANNYEATRDITNKSELKVRCVGERLFGECAYYEIYTRDEHTQIYLKLKTNAIKRFIFKTIGWNFHRKDFQKFYAIQKQLNINGWTTLDLS
jgi:hypothetical protein